MVAVVGSPALPAPALAVDEIVVEEYRCGSGCTGTCTPTLYSTTYYDHLEDIDIEVVECTRRLNIYAVDNDPEFTIGDVDITHTGDLPQFVEIFIGQGTFPYGMGQTTAAAGDFEGLAADHEGLRDRILFAGRIAGDQLGGVIVGKVYRWEVDGVMQAGISAELSPEAEGLFNVFAGSVTIGHISADAGTITRVDITGDMGAPISALDEGVKQVIVGGNFTGSWINAGDFINTVTVGGNIGTSTTAVQIKTFNSGGSIGTIEADNINGNITAGSTGTGDLQQIRTTASSFFKGLITVLDVDGQPSEPGLDIAGNLDADVTIKGNVNAPIEIAGALLSTGRIDIYGALASAGQIDIAGSAGLNGRVIINSSNGSSAWSGTVEVGSTTLSPSGAYTQTGLGGGAVGLVPFQCHLQDCSPVDSATVTSWTPSTSTVTLRHYGLVTWTGMPVIVSKCPYPSNCDPSINIITSEWQVNNSPGTRDVVLKLASGQSLTADTIYYFRPLRTGTDMLKCTGIAASGNVAVGDYTYSFIYDP